jgi:hypothetical protein
MAFITRNATGEITAIYESKQSGENEYLAIDNPELINFISQSTSNNDIKTALSSSDVDIARVLEDLINTLIDKKVILFTDLPIAAQEKLVSREQIRGHLNSLDNLMSDHEGIL